MSEPKLISPLLDGCIVGEAMSDHHGVRCYPAIRENTDERYIVKIISIPASQVQLDALLLTGAYADEQDALAYFKELSDGVTGESDILTRLSRLEGFIAYSGIQTQQMEEGVGYEVYLISPYKRTLLKQMRRSPLTQLDAVNLGLDMCAALAVARRAGYLYVNLKPENIFLTENQGFRIGDLGFIPLTSLKYASLPEKYRSSYTAPEISDVMSTLNDTLDIYALGLTLYQVYNNGQLPFEGSAPSEPLPTPLYADYEMAEIILKACAPDPKDRWQDPAQMGQELVNYMQRNSVNAVPIVPPPVELAEEPEEVEEFLSEDENEAALAALLEQLPDEEPPAEDPETTEEAEPGESEENSEEADAVDEAEEAEASDDAEDLSFMEHPDADETLPTEESAAELEDAPVTDEVAQMLAVADELISHELPEGVVQPEPIDVPFPPPIIPEPEEPEVPEEAEGTEDSDQEASSAEPESTEESEKAESEQEEPVVFAPNAIRGKKKKKKPVKPGPIIAIVATIVILIALAACGHIYYTDYYIQTLDSLTVYGTEDQINVAITSEVDESLLTIVCTDTYGNTQRSPVVSGVARFVNLNPGTQYRITAEISGFHKLKGSITGTYTTATQTEIRDFIVVNGPEEGSVNLRFTVIGPEKDGWSVEYTAGGTAPQTKYFTGHSVTITGLTVEREYIFKLVPKGEVYLAGEAKVTFTPNKFIYAQNLAITAWDDGNLTAQWSAPEGVENQNWIVRCTSDLGYDKTITVAEPLAQFTDLDPTTKYIITVTAEGMPQEANKTVEAKANPITVTGFTATPKGSDELEVSWAFRGKAPENGWIFTYTIDGGAPVKMENITHPKVSIPLYPGSHYTFSLKPGDDVDFFCQDGSYDAPKPASFEGYLVTAEDMDFYLCRTPDKENWDRHDLKDADYKTAFAVGEKASFLVYLKEKYNTSNDKITVTYIIRDTDGRPVSRGTWSNTWTKMWHKRYCELDIPQMPATAGKYTIEVYFNGLYVTTESFSIT